MEILAKISKGSIMDQVYLPKNRTGLETGSFVIVKPIQEAEEIGNIKKQLSSIKPYFYDTKSIEPIKLEIIIKTFEIIDKLIKNDDIIITGSFLDIGFNFNDMDILIISNNKINESFLKEKILSAMGISAHIISFDKKTLEIGLSTDPLYSLMLSKCISKKRLIFNIKRKIDYKLLDIHLLKSEPLIHSFDILNGNQKYYLIRNLIAIKLFIEGKKLNNKDLENKIKNLFNIKIREIKENMLNKKDFLRKYKKMYKETQNKIFSFIK